MFGPIFFATKGKHRGKAIHGGLRTSQEFSQASYAPPDRRPPVIEGARYDRFLSDQNSAVYANPENNRVIIAFRGTVPTEGRDLFDDLRIVTSTFAGSQRVKDGKALVKQAAEKYGIPVQEVELTGHSLGGRISQAVGSQLHSERFTGLNVGSSPLDILFRTAGSGQGRTYTTGIDPISISNTLASGGQGVSLVAPQTVEPHGLAAFGSN